LLLRYYNFSNRLLETQQIIKTDNFLIEFGPTSTNFLTVKNKSYQFSNTTCCIRKTRIWTKCLFP